jgi:hypothetical protein
MNWKKLLEWYSALKFGEVCLLAMVIMDEVLDILKNIDGAI